MSQTPQIEPRSPERDWQEYVEIENARIASRLGLQTAWPWKSEWDAVPPSERFRQPELKEIETNWLAAELLTHAKDDIEMCAKEYRKAHPDQRGQPEDTLRDRELVREEVIRLWPHCKKLARQVAEPLTNRMVMEEVRDYCRKLTQYPDAEFAPVITHGRRSEMLADLLQGTKNSKTTRTFLGHSLWFIAYKALRKLGQVHSAEELFLEAADHYAQIQEDIKFVKSRAERVYRSQPYFRLTQHYYETGEKASAARYAMLTFIEDVLTDHFNEQNPLSNHATGITRFLWTRFRVGHHQLRRLMEQIKSLEDEANSNDWLSCLIHPEYVLALLMSERIATEDTDSHSAKPEKVTGNLFPLELRHHQGSRAQYPVDAKLLQKLWTLRDSKQDADAKGKWLERVMVYLFSTIEGLRVRRDVKTREGSSQLDLLIDCPPHSAHWLNARMGERIIVECKNTGDPESVDTIFKLLAKMEYHGCDTGIAVCRSGLSGTNRGMHARALGRQLGASRRILCVNEADLKLATEQEKEEAPPGFLSTVMTWLDLKWDEHRD